jgi:hypothetical protein
MKTEAGKVSKPIRDLMDSKKYGRVIFKVSDFKQQFNTRTAALGNRNRHGFDIYTQSRGEYELHVIKRGCEDLPGRIVDLREQEWFGPLPSTEECNAI